MLKQTNISRLQTMFPTLSQSFTKVKTEYIILIVKNSFDSVDTNKEATLVYQTVKENQTLASTTCSSKLIRQFLVAIQNLH